MKSCWKCGVKFEEFSNYCPFDQRQLYLPGKTIDARHPLCGAAKRYSEFDQNGFFGLPAVL